MVTAVVLAAGAGRRMGGRPKALLTIDGETFLERVAQTCRDGGAKVLVVVTRAEPPEISRIARSLGATVVENPEPDRGMFSSVTLGLEAALRDDPGGILVFPVDHPRVLPATVAALVRALPDRPPRTWLRPAHDGRGGHPILVDRETTAALAALDSDTTLRDALHGLGLTPHSIPVDDPGIRANLNRPEDLA